jgi:hypothetical protein
MKPICTGVLRSRYCDDSNPANRSQVPEVGLTHATHAQKSDALCLFIDHRTFAFLKFTDLDERLARVLRRPGVPIYPPRSDHALR